MSVLVILKNKQAVTTSLVLAEIFDKQHKNVIQVIEEKIQSAENPAHYNSMFVEDEYEDSRGRKQKMYVMNRDGWSFIAFGFTGAKADKFKLMYIDQFNQMEQRIKEQQVKLPSDPMEILELTFKAQEQTNERVVKVEQDVKYLKSEIKLESSNYMYVGRRVGQKIYEVIRGRGLNPDAQAPLRKELNGDIATLVGVRTRSQIKEKDFNKVIDFIDRWQPSTLAMDIVRQLELELEEKGLGGRG